MPTLLPVAKGRMVLQQLWQHFPSRRSTNLKCLGDMYYNPKVDPCREHNHQPSYSECPVGQPPA